MLVSFALIFSFCELGEQIMSQFNKIDEEICNFDWHLLPLDIQKIYPIIMIGTQAPVMLIGMGNIECTREAFKKVSELI